MKVTEAKNRANAENAKKSTGPRTERGKDISKYNATKDGCYARQPIFKNEDERARFAELVAAYRTRFSSTDPITEMLVRQEALDAWKAHLVDEWEVRELRSRISNKKDNQALEMMMDYAPDAGECNPFVGGNSSGRVAPWVCDQFTVDLSHKHLNKKKEHDTTIGDERNEVDTNENFAIQAHFTDRLDRIMRLNNAISRRRIRNLKQLLELAEAKQKNNE